MRFNFEIFVGYMDNIGRARQKAIEGFAFANDRAFVPEIGASYEIHFGSVTLNGQTGFAFAQIRADGVDPIHWVELKSGEPLPKELRGYAVQAYKKL